MDRHRAVVYQLDFRSTPATEGRTASGPLVSRAAARPGPAVCAVCARYRARLTLERTGGQPPVRVCLACHHAVMKHRKMMRNGLPERVLPSLPQEVGLIVPQGGELSGASKYATLDHRRRRAQIAARRALDVAAEAPGTVRQAS